MYSIGDKIAIPMCGAGVIEEIRQVSVLDKTSFYYVVNLSHDKMTVLIPVINDEGCKIRPIATCSQINEAIDVLSSEATPMEKSWSKRIKENNKRLESGSLLIMADIIRNLYLANLQHPLASGEKKMLKKAVDIMASEISLVLEINFEKAKERIYEVM